jgi:TPP-dependent 2-oxoacid decarboxylase
MEHWYQSEPKTYFQNLLSLLPPALSTGGPNSNDFAANHTVHHTIGEKDLGQQYRAFKEVTCAAVVVQHLTEAHHQIDQAIAAALVSGPGVLGLVLRY